MTNEIPPVSPALSGLVHQVAVAGPAALARFWQKIGEQGAPLIEPVPGDDRQALVTFIWRETGANENIALVSNLNGQMGASEAMTRLVGTDLWHRTYVLPSDTRESYQFAVAGDNLTDPLNFRRHSFPSDPEVGLAGWESSVLELPDAPAQPWIAARPGVPRGAVALHRIRNDTLDHEYRVWVYTPPAFTSDGAPYGWLLIFDGWFYLELIPTPTILDNLLAGGVLPPLVAVLVGHPFDKYRRRDLACYPPFDEFLLGELLPWARQEYNLTGDPMRTAAVGASLGGLMAAYVGLQHPGIVGNVLAQSAYFGWKHSQADEDEWIVRQYAAMPPLPLRFSIEAGLFETDQPTPLPGNKNLLLSARHMRDILKAKGNPVRYAEFSGGHSPLNWRGTLADDLQALLGRGVPGRLL